MHVFRAGVFGGWGVLFFCAMGLTIVRVTNFGECEMEISDLTGYYGFNFLFIGLERLKAIGQALREKDFTRGQLKQG